MRISHLAAVSLLAIAVSGCTAISGDVAPTPEAVRSGSEAKQRADVNPGYKAGAGQIPTKRTASLGEIIAKTDRAPKKESPTSKEDRLREPAMREAATAYGARAGLAYGTREINRRLEARAAELSTSYNFQSLMISGPNGVMVNPPIIVEAQESWESSDAGKTLRVADTVYEIVEQSRFTSVAPMWQAYLISNFDEAETPPDALLPRTAGEKENWKRWVSEGWRQGEEQANEIFQANLDRLNRDYTGMVRYKTLLEEGKVSPARLAEAELGNTGTGQDMRVNDRAIRITEDPTLQVSPRGWSASATSKDKEGNDKGAAVQAEDQPAAKPARKPSNAKRTTSKASKSAPAAASNKSVDAPKPKKGGRF